MTNNEPTSQRIELVNVILEALEGHALVHPWDVFTMKAKQAAEHLLLLEKIDDGERQPLQVIPAAMSAEVKCVNNGPIATVNGPYYIDDELTEDETYLVHFTGTHDGERYVWVENNYGNVKGYKASRFVGVTE